MRSLASISWAWARPSFLGLALVLSVLVLAACAKPGEKGVTPAEGLMFTCQTYGDTLLQVSELNAAGKVKKAHQDIVDGVVETLGPICTGPAPNVNAKLKDVTINNGVQILKTVLLISLSGG